MLNAEKYRDEILKILEDDSLAFDESTKSVCGCEECHCHNCKFSIHQTNCGLERYKWLMEEYEEQILTYEELEYLKAVCKPFEKYVIYIEKSNKNIAIKLSDYINYANIYIPYEEYTNLRFSNIESYKKYTLSELGISYDE